jgi:hypothetical protein
VHRTFGKTAHPEQPLLQFIEVALKMAFHSLHPLCTTDPQISRRAYRFRISSEVVISS